MKRKIKKILRIISVILLILLIIVAVVLLFDFIINFIFSLGFVATIVDAVAIVLGMIFMDWIWSD